MRLVLSVLCSGAIGFLFGVLWHESFGVMIIGEKGSFGHMWWRSRNEEVLTTIAIFSLFAIPSFFMFYNKIFKGIKNFKSTAMDLVASSKDIIHSKSISLSDTDKNSVQYYGKAEEEINTGMMQKDLWALSLVKAKGKEDLRKAEYIKLRVKQLQNEE